MELRTPPDGWSAKDAIGQSTQWRIGARDANTRGAAPAPIRSAAGGIAGEHRRRTAGELRDVPGMKKDDSL